ncbi:hypothetical protein A2572_01715 [Candidatus Collierbacteria bacterium RIFOXYD1_FULL_40_9]|uniref:MEDS domain-containing protein n=1 Tax=Candidatus Collierbacteria bacterium RIFOXYD1_FULL_40_9 TaxID=1817731 RepID=A0A1F5FPA4_9BACT|nr:MAG: hypothetical protein A2572_01715 [Candidatus Collierbacteria bacterium RIFOXYD1_FULL_40_9]
MKNLLNFGDHVISIYQNQSQQISQITPYISAALNQNQKCVYVIDNSSLPSLVSEFEKNGLNLEKYLDSKQFVFKTANETYVADGSFDPDNMLSLVAKLIDSALQEGFDGLLGIGEMSWILKNVSDSKKLNQYESNLNSLRENKAALICQYDESQFSKDFLVDVIRAHPHTVIYGSFHPNKYFYTPPEYFRSISRFPKDSYKTMIDIITGN